MKKSIVASVIGILLCLLCLSGTTWAWYSSSVESGENETIGANFDFSVETMRISDGSGIDNVTVTLTRKGTAEKGFCKVIATKPVEEENTTQTTYFIIDFTKANPISFTITVTGSDILEFIPMWGTPTEYCEPILENENMLESASNSNDAEVDQEEEEIEEPEIEPEKETLPEGETPSNDTPTNPESTEPPTEPISEPTEEQLTEPTDEQ